MQNLIPLYRFENLYTLFYDKKDGEIYKVKHRKAPNYATVIVIFSVMLLMNLIGEIYIVQENPTIGLIILFGSLVATYFLTPLYIKWYYRFKTKETSYMYEDYAKKGAKSGLKQYRLDLILALISTPLALLFGYLFLKNAQIGTLMLTCLLFALILIFTSTKPHLRKKLLKEMNAEDQ